jgi:hypothetical protein
LSDSTGTVTFDFFKIVGEYLDSVSFEVGVRVLLSVGGFEGLPFADDGFVSGGVGGLVVAYEEYSSRKEG